MGSAPSKADEAERPRARGVFGDDSAKAMSSRDGARVLSDVARDEREAAEAQAAAVTIEDVRESAHAEFEKQHARQPEWRDRRLVTDLQPVLPLDAPERRPKRDEKASVVHVQLDEDDEGGAAADDDAGGGGQHQLRVPTDMYLDENMKRLSADDYAAAVHLDRPVLEPSYDTTSYGELLAYDSLTHDERRVLKRSANAGIFTGVAASALWIRSTLFPRKATYHRRLNSFARYARFRRVLRFQDTSTAAGHAAVQSRYFGGADYWMAFVTRKVPLAVIMTLTATTTSMFLASTVALTRLRRLDESPLLERLEREFRSRTPVSHMKMRHGERGSSYGFSQRTEVFDRPVTRGQVADQPRE